MIFPAWDLRSVDSNTKRYVGHAQVMQLTFFRSFWVKQAGIDYMYCYKQSVGANEGLRLKGQNNIVRKLCLPQCNVWHYHGNFRTSELRNYTSKGKFER